ncbi:putative nucleotidyltransferase, ribonuclease H [Tanacetum coccineum]|uniref:Nucleotidyltransferase, ribonuclease H n=1 Tax=Tanacetum coccineum TaxID=301880 RepID=A0ABQ5A2T1_9ASTR
MVLKMKNGKNELTIFEVPKEGYTRNNLKPLARTLQRIGLWNIHPHISDKNVEEIRPHPFIISEFLKIKKVIPKGASDSLPVIIASDLLGSREEALLKVTFQRCMISNFDMVEESLEMFMDDFSIFVKKLLEHWSKQQKNYFFSQLNYYIWEDQKLYIMCADQVIRCCVSDYEHMDILAHCYSYTYEGYFSAKKIGHKVLQSGFFWPAIFKDAHLIVKACKHCQQVEGITRCDQMPMNPILVVENFDVWGINFMGPFSTSYGNLYILVAVDFVSQWIEAEATWTSNHKWAIKPVNIDFDEAGIARKLQI